MTQLPFPLPPEDLMPRRRLWTVSDLNEKVRVVLESALQEVWVEGEISNFRPAQSGHLYFTLKDSRAQIRCVCFRDQARGLKFRPEDGLQVTVRGSLGVYAARGEYQIYVESIEPMGLGALQLAFDQLKERLSQEGLFASAGKKPLPAVPRRIGVITSPTGAAIRDILHVLARRFASAHVQLYPVKVQGDGAAREIVEALRYFNIWESVDVLIVARGGGSLEDLWAFNEEIVARAISDSRIPVITGVGHETDFTIADFVADVRAPTPSAAAEIVIRTRQEFEQQIAEAHRGLVRRMQYLLSEWRHRVRDLETHRGFRQSEVLNPPAAAASGRLQHRPRAEFAPAPGWFAAPVDLGTVIGGRIRSARAGACLASEARTPFRGPAGGAGSRGGRETAAAEYRANAICVT